ncbi:unnamed protein product [Alternaria alternata]
MTVPSFETIFAVPMTCQSCINDIEGSLQQLGGTSDPHARHSASNKIGINKVTANLKDQLVSIEGTAAPSAIVEAIQATGRDAILRGSGRSDKNKVRGLVRMVEVAPSMTIIDLSIRGLSPGTYHATIRESGNISDGPESTGAIWEHHKAKQEGKPCRGVFGTVQVGKGGVGSVFLDKPIHIWEMIGRSIVVAKEQDGKVCETR